MYKGPCVPLQYTQTDIIVDCKVNVLFRKVLQMFVHSLPGSIAAEMSDWASLTLFMASSISLLDASAFRLALIFKPAAKGFSLNKRILIS